MKTMKTFLWGTLFLAFSGQARAFYDSQPSSAVVFCQAQNAAVVSTQLFDDFENKLFHSEIILQDLSGLSQDQIVSQLVNDIKKLDPDRGTRLWDRYQKFFNNVTFDKVAKEVSGIETYPLHVPEHCQIKHVVFRVTNFSPFAKMVVIDKDAWAILSEANRAGLILHEILTADLNSENHYPDESAIRYLNGVVRSESFSSMNLDQYVDIMKSIGVELIRTVEGIRYFLESLVFFPGFLQVKSGVLADITNVQIFSGKLAPFFETIEYYESGHIKIGRLCDGMELMTVDGSYERFLNDRLLFTEDGRVIKSLD